jgi:hypothetical protein
MYKRQAFLVALIPCVAAASPTYETIRVPQATSAICGQLGEVAYWAATSHLSKKDKQRLTKAEFDARAPNKLRPAIPAALIDEARKFGVISHGNAGPGNTSLDGARADGIGTAMLVYEMCLEGRLGR